jgi:hypothetical protein
MAPHIGGLELGPVGPRVDRPPAAPRAAQPRTDVGNRQTVGEAIDGDNGLVPLGSDPAPIPPQAVQETLNWPH